MDDGGYGAVLEHARDAAIVVDSDAIIRYANPQVGALLGDDAARVVNDDLLAIVHPEDRADLERTVADLDSVSDAAPVDVTVRVVRSDGETIRVEARIAPSGTGYVIWLRDAETDSRELAERYRMVRDLFDATDDVLWVFNDDWTELLFATGVAEDTWGIPIEDLQEDPTRFLDAVYPDQREEVVRAMERLSGGEPVELTYRVNPEEEYGVWVWIRAIPVFEDGEVARVAGISREVTELQKRNQQARVIDHVIRHQIRNRLTVILGSCDMLADRVDADAVDRIVDNCYTLLELQSTFGEILDTIVDPGPTREFDLAELTRRLAGNIRSDHPDAEIELDLPPSAPVEAIDRLPKAVHELIVCAVTHASTSAAKVATSVDREEAAVTLTVVDRRCHIPESELQIIAGGAEVSKLTHGTGLGLWLVKWIVDQSDGSFSIQPDGPRGNVLEVSLPQPPETELEELEDAIH